jgi:hypothetical protein
MRFLAPTLPTTDCPPTATLRGGDAATRRSWPLVAVIASACFAVPVRAQRPEHAHMDHMPSASAKQTLSPQTLAQLQAVRDATARYQSIDSAMADGYVRFGKIEGPLMGQHWYRKDDVRKPLDFMHPSTLQYATINGKLQLMGVAYTTYQHPGDPIPEGFAGDADHWHQHDIAKLARALVADRPFLSWRVEQQIKNGKIGGGDGKTMLVMVHAWVWTDNPDGVFALEDRALPYARAGLPASFAQGASEDAAWGVALASPTGCADEIARTNALAKLAPSQRQKLETACEQQAARVRGVLSARSTAQQLNAAAETAWRAYSRARAGILEPDQTARLASVMEHDPMAMGQAH